MDSEIQNKLENIRERAFNKLLKRNNVDKLTQKKRCDIMLNEIFKDNSLSIVYKSLKKKSLKNKGLKNKGLKVEKTFKVFKKNFKKGFIKACTRKI